jgi:Carboxypeptidase regulatory-like domain
MPPSYIIAASSIMTKLVILIAAALTIAAVAAAQPRPTQPLAEGTSSIRGTLVDAVSKKPIADCPVRATSRSGSNVVSTGDDGAYQFSAIAEGTYGLLIQCPSYVMSLCLKPNDQPGPQCSEVTVFRDQTRTVDVALVPGGVIRGRVLDGSGKPVAKAIVRVGRPMKDVPLFMSIGTITATDGTYELRSVPAGEWPLQVELPSAPRTLLPPTVYYPGTLAFDDAGLVEIAIGATKDNVVINVPRLLDSPITVRVPPPDSTLGAVNVVLTRLAPLANYRIELDGEGTGNIKGLTEGRYFMTAAAMSGKEKWVAFQRLEFIGDPIEVFLNLQPVGGIRGRIVPDRDGIPALEGTRIAAVWVDEDGVPINPIAPEEGVIAADGSFEINGLFGRRLLRLIGFDADWRIDSVKQGRSDVGEAIDVIPGAVTELTISVSRRR